MAIFPGAVATDSDLYIAVNQTTTQLTDNPLTVGATTVNVVSATAFPTVGFISIDSEIIKYTGKTATSFTGCTRGADGTSAASHVQNSQVYHNVIAAHHNAPKDEIIALEQFISDVIGRTNTQVRAPAGSLALPGISFAVDTDTGFFQNGSNDLRAVAGGVLSCVFSGNQILTPDGSAANPSHTFINDTDTGIYRQSNNQLGITTGGILRWTFLSDGGLFSNDEKYIQIGNGTALAPSYSFVNDIDTGMYRAGSNILAFAAGGVVIADFQSFGLEIASGKKIVNDPGSAAAPSYTFDLDTDTGIYHVGANILGFATNGLIQWVINSTGALIGQQTGGVVKLEPATAAIPAYSFTADADTGIYNSTANQLAISLGGIKAFESVSAGTSDDATYRPGRFFGGTSTSYSSIANQTTSVTTSAKQILDITSENAGLIVVYGDDGAGNRFADLILATFAATTPTTITSKTALGSPVARTYSMAVNGVVRLAMASGTYTIHTTSLAIN